MQNKPDTEGHILGDPTYTSCQKQTLGSREYALEGTEGKETQGMVQGVQFQLCKMSEF